MSCSKDMLSLCLMSLFIWFSLIQLLIQYQQRNIGSVYGVYPAEVTNSHTQFQFDSFTKRTRRRASRALWLFNYQHPDRMGSELMNWNVPLCLLQSLTHTFSMYTLQAVTRDLLDVPHFSCQAVYELLLPSQWRLLGLYAALEVPLFWVQQLCANIRNEL